MSHNCEPSWVKDESNSSGYGLAVDYCQENEHGELWVGNGEYASRVNFCPFCGYKAPLQVKEEA